MALVTQINNQQYPVTTLDPEYSRINNPRVRVTQWGPTSGFADTIVTATVEFSVSDFSESAPLMKLTFGPRLAITTQQVCIPNRHPAGNQFLIIKLEAHVPVLSDFGLDENETIPVSICCFDSDNVTATSANFFGDFLYFEAEEARQTQSATQERRSSYLSPIFNGENSDASETELLPFVSAFGRLPTPESTDTAPEMSQSVTEQSPPATHLYQQPPNERSDQDFSAAQPFYQESSTNAYGYYTSPVSQHQPFSSIQPAPALMNSDDLASGLLNYDNLTNQQFSGNYPGPSSLVGVGSTSLVSRHQRSQFSRSQSGQFYNQARPIHLAHGGVNGNSEQPYPFQGIYSKNILKINGRLDTMTMGWSHAQWTSSRRLVKFTRSQYNTSNGNVIECGFVPIEQAEYDMIRQSEAHGRRVPLIVSCIYWSAKNEYMITSVDCIFLLEDLLNVQFTVEEKNRIRRNLEGFKPMTVCKAKVESIDFFRLIMSFPHPRPRNIEKDVKVFPWSALPLALAKVIKKYTPSYSSTIPR